MTAFDAAADVIFTDENLSRAATWRQNGAGPSKAIRVVFARPERGVAFGETGVVSRDITARIRLSDVAEPKRGDTLTINGTLYRIERSLGDTNTITSLCTLSVVTP